MKGRGLNRLVNGVCHLDGGTGVVARLKRCKIYVDKYTGTCTRTHTHSCGSSEIAHLAKYFLCRVHDSCFSPQYSHGIEYSALSET